MISFKAVGLVEENPLPGRLALRNLAIRRLAVATLIAKSNRVVCWMDADCLTVEDAGTARLGAIAGETPPETLTFRGRSSPADRRMSGGGFWTWSSAFCTVDRPPPWDACRRSQRSRANSPPPLEALRNRRARRRSCVLKNVMPRHLTRCKIGANGSIFGNTFNEPKCDLDSFLRPC